MKSAVLVFDFDDTLVSSKNAYEKALAAIGYSLDDSSYLEARSAVKVRLGDGHVSARNRWLYFKDICGKKSKFNVSELVSMAELYEKVLLEDFTTQWKALKRDELFRELAVKAHLIILTNENTRLQILKLRAIDPDSKYFDGIVTSEEVGSEKPNLSMFHRVIELYPKHHSEQMTMVGDSLENDIEPAERLGWHAIWTREFLNGKSSNSLELNRSSVTRLDEIRNLL